MIVKTELLEINKPSALCQILFFEDYKKGILAEITAFEIDIINYLYYEAKKSILKDNIKISDDDTFQLVVNFKELSTTLNKYKTSNYEYLIKHLRDLKSKEVIINVLGKNKNITSETYTSFIQKIKVISNKYEKRQKCKVYLDGEILNMFINIKKYFSKMYLSIQYNLQFKQSKLLYELLKDYKNIKTITIDFIMVVGLLNSSSKRNLQFAFFNNDILKKAIKEINEKSDIKVTYEPIKEKLEGQRKQVTKIKFNIEEQDEQRLEELGLLNQEEELSIEDQILMNKAEQVYNNLPKFRKDKITDSQSYIKSIFKKDYDKLKNELRLDSWINDNIVVNSDQPQTLSILINENAYAITDNYVLVDLDTNKYTTSDATETIDFINDIINTKEYQKDYTIEMLELGIKQEFSKSSVNF